MFLISRSFPAQIITSGSCAGGNCQAILDKPDLSKEKPSYYINDIFKSESGQYWRLTFLEEATQDSKINVKITNPSDKDKEIKAIEVKKSTENIPQEVIFHTDNNYSDLLFEKDDSGNAEINISNVHISKLKIENEKEFSSLKQTIRGKMDVNHPDQSQENTGYLFNQLKDPDVILGQIFKPESEYISSVKLDIDIIKQDNNGGKKYKLELREAEYDGEAPDVTSNVLASVDFTSENIEKYRQDDGKFKFPVFARLDKEKYYFIGINNGNVAVDKFNYLRLRGTSDKSQYSNGIVAIKTKGKTYSAPGDLYFITYGLDFEKYLDKKILRGEIIEDIGKGQGMFTYQPGENIYNLADLYEYSPEIDYDDSKNVLFGKMQEGQDSFMIYKFETIYPFTKMKLTGKQANASWGKISISYSYDKNKWTEIPDSMADAQGHIGPFQYFDFSWDAFHEDEIYVKIAPKEFEEGKKYGLGDLRVEADLLMK